MTFLRGFSVNAVAGGLTFAIAFANQALIARGLGPQQRGVLALVATSVTLGGMVLGEWLSRGNSYYAGRQPARIGSVWTNTTCYSLVVLLLAIALAATAGTVPTLSTQMPLSALQLLLAAALIAVVVAQRGFLGVLLGADRLTAYALIPLLFITCYLGLNSIGLGWVGGGLTAVLMAWLAAVTVAALAAALVGRGVGPTDGALLRATAGVGGRGAVSATLIFLLFRSDVYLVDHYLGADQLGVYAIAVVVAEMMQRGPNIAGTVMLPKVLRGIDDDHGMSLDISRWVLLFSLLTAIAVVAVGAPLIRWAFGADYAGAHQPLVWMLPGLVAAGYGSVLNTKLAGQGYPPVTMWAPAAALAANVILNVILIPRLGLVGAALSTSAAYVLWVAIIIVAYSRITGVPLRRMAGGRSA